MQRKIIISLLILILLILLWRSCKPDLDHPQKTSEIPKVEIPEKLYIHKSGIYLLKKNWNKETLESFIKKETHLKILNPRYTEIVFITNLKDSIEFSVENINSKEPIIFFNQNKAPFLSNKKDYQETESFFFPDLVQNTDTLVLDKTHSISDTEIEEDISLEIRERTVISYETIKYKTIRTLEVPSRNSSLKKKREIELADRSQYYPLLNYNQFIELGFDNDFWDYTDYYYTNGVYLSYSHPFFVKSPLSYLLVSNGKSGVDYYGITLVQNMYTGIQPKVDSIVPGDRPWAAYTMLGQNLISFDSKNKVQHYSEINFGIVGPYSGGGFIQDLVHTILPNNSPPQGWHNQINTDYIIDYQYKLRSLLYEDYKFESYLIAGAQVGTLRDNLKWGFGGKYGNFIPFYLDMATYNRKRLSPNFPRKIRFNFLIEIETQLIGYDATLQGGITDRRSVYVIPPGQINRFVIEGIGGLVLSYGRFELQFIQHWKSKEFKTGKDHKYVSVRLKTAF